MVYGRDVKARKAIYDFLQAVGLAPVQWRDALARAPGGAPFVGEILDRAFEGVSAVIVLFTPDDEARLRADLLRNNDPEYEAELTPQPRPNVLFEAGMAFGRHPEKTVLVSVGCPLRRVSDLAGRHVVDMDGSEEKRRELLDQLKSLGCPVCEDSDAWKTAGEFPAP